MEDKISIVFCSEKTSDENKNFIDHLKGSCGCNASVYMIYNPNGLSLAKIYGDMMESDDIDTDVMVFVHDDVEFLKNDWGTEILRLFNENKDYGIIGVAGSAEFDAKGAWWNYRKKYGQVLHRNEGKSWLTAFSPLLDHDLEQVVAVDGLFIAVNRKRIAKGFDKELEGFDFYDIDFCLANFIEGKCKIGVTTNIRMAHDSIDKLKESWYKNRDIINKKYNQYYPIEL